MARRKSDIISQSEHIRERMVEAYERVIGSPGRPHFRVSLLEPPVDVYETDAAVVILVEIAGIVPDAISLDVEGRVLVLAGERRSLRQGPRRAYAQIEICDGPFQREISLPAEVNSEKARAVYKDGMLEISLPKTSPVARRRLKIVDLSSGTAEAPPHER